MTEETRQHIFPEQLHGHRVVGTTTKIADLRVDMIGVDLLVTDHSLPAPLPTLPTGVLRP